MDERDPLSALAVRGFYLGKARFWHDVGLFADGVHQLSGKVQAKLDL